jgi:hypothetical protein
VSRALTRVATAALTGLVTTLLTAAPAFADNPIGTSEGEDAGKGLGTVGTILLYVVVPLAVAFGIFLLVWLPGAVKANRYRPNKGWHATPVWFAGPPDPVDAVQKAETGDVVRGGASGTW